MTRKQLNLGLLIVALGLGAAVYFSQKKEDEKGPPLTALKADAVTTIAVEHPDASPIKLEKQGGAWKLIEPVLADTDPFEINALVALADTVTEATLEPDKVKLTDLNLEPPLYRITLNDQVLEFGGVEPLKFRRYVKTGDKIYLIEDPASAALDRDYSDLISRSLLPEGVDVQSIAVPGLTVSRTEDGKSWIAQPAPDGVSQETIQKFVDAWKNAKGMWNGAEPREGSKGDGVSVVLADGREINFIVAERDPQLIIARPDLNVRYTPSKALADELFKLAEPKPPEPAPEPAAAPPAPAVEGQ